MVGMPTQASSVADLEALRSSIGTVPLRSPNDLVNVIGGVPVEHWHRLAEFPLASFDHLLTTNLRYVLVGCQTVASAMIADGRHGAMVNVSSIASRGQPLLSAYGPPRRTRSLTRSMAMEWSRRGIRVNNVAPGINTRGRGDRLPTSTIRAAAAIPSADRARQPTSPMPASSSSQSCCVHHRPDPRC